MPDRGGREIGVCLLLRFSDTPKLLLDDFVFGGLAILSNA